VQCKIDIRRGRRTQGSELSVEFIRNQKDQLRFKHANVRCTSIGTVNFLQNKSRDHELISIFILFLGFLILLIHVEKLMIRTLFYSLNDASGGVIEIVLSKYL